MNPLVNAFHFAMKCLKSSLKKFCGRYRDLVNHLPDSEARPQSESVTPSNDQILIALFPESICKWVWHAGRSRLSSRQLDPSHFELAKLYQVNQAFRSPSYFSGHYFQAKLCLFVVFIVIFLLTFINRRWSLFMLGNHRLQGTRTPFFPDSPALDPPPHPQLT